ncbi:MAG: hypothetical protein LBB13_01240 [Rickettsiales bacterium]|jgi:hypothetical protein|nr:hypothetical protein [Rickettsiales bacterium]
MMVNGKNYYVIRGLMFSLMLVSSLFTLKDTSAVIISDGGEEEEEEEIVGANVAVEAADLMINVLYADNPQAGAIEITLSHDGAQADLSFQGGINLDEINYLSIIVQGNVVMGEQFPILSILNPQGLSFLNVVVDNPFVAIEKEIIQGESINVIARVLDNNMNFESNRDNGANGNKSNRNNLFGSL